MISRIVIICISLVYYSCTNPNNHSNVPLDENRDVLRVIFNDSLVQELYMTSNQSKNEKIIFKCNYRITDSLMNNDGIVFDQDSSTTPLLYIDLEFFTPTITLVSISNTQNTKCHAIVEKGDSIKIIDINLFEI